MVIFEYEVFLDVINGLIPNFGMAILILKSLEFLGRIIDWEKIEYYNEKFTHFLIIPFSFILFFNIITVRNIFFTIGIAVMLTYLIYDFIIKRIMIDKIDFNSKKGNRIKSYYYILFICMQVALLTNSLLITVQTGLMILVLIFITNTIFIMYLKNYEKSISDTIRETSNEVEKTLDSNISFKLEGSTDEDFYIKIKLIVLLLFFLIRIPILFFQSYWYLEESLVNSLETGYQLYCDFEHYTTFWQIHLYPPGTYIYMIIRVYFFKNSILLISDFINLLLMYNLIKKFNGEKSAIIGMIFYAFLPISIMNNGLTNDPMTICLTFILLGFYFFINKKRILSSICLAIGTLIIYIPAIILIPIFFFYAKNKQYKNFLVYIFIFITVIFLGILPFLLVCPENFINYIYLSLNDPHSSNFLENRDFILSHLLSLELFNVFNFGIKIINIYQIILLLIFFYILYKKFEYADERDIIITSIVLITLIMILTFYTHVRFYYWIFILSYIFLSFNGKEIFDRKFSISKLVIYGIITFSISLFSVIIFQISINNYIEGFWEFYGVVLFFFVANFLITGMIFFNETYTRTIILFICLLYFVSMSTLLLTTTSNLYLLNFGLMGLIFLSFIILIYFIKKTLLSTYKRIKVIEIVSNEPETE
jgi:hypothetical protein